MKSTAFIPYVSQTFSTDKTLIRSREHLEYMSKRRSLRHFSKKKIPKKVITNILLTASSAPSGAHKQPWTFCAISNKNTKAIIRKAAENEEYINYHGRMSEVWLKDLEPFDTDWHKQFITEAPWIIVIFKKSYEETSLGKKKNYYVNESVGIAAGFLISAIHNAGLVTLTHTPSPMNFLQKVLNRPANEKPFLLLPIGYPAKNAEVPKLQRKQESEVIIWHE